MMHLMWDSSCYFCYSAVHFFLFHLVYTDTLKNLEENNKNLDDAKDQTFIRNREKKKRYQVYPINL